jgi:hypothetical protein
VHGYVSWDHVTGIGKTADGKYTAPPMGELEQRLSQVSVTPEMLERIKALRAERMGADACAACPALK